MKRSIPWWLVLPFAPIVAGVVILGAAVVIPCVFVMCAIMGAMDAMKAHGLPISRPPKWLLGFSNGKAWKEASK